MAGTVSEESGDGRSLEGVSSGQQPCQSMEALAEWRSSEQVENGITSTSPPYWDTDDDDCGPKPSELYGKYTWKIDKFSQINKRELRSNAFEVGGYKWYILIYPQGCDVCNHLSLFLCVANHDKLLPGWSHFAQFTIAVVNKDPKKSKYSDTLHRFWKKEHDWGWKKFMELSKVLDGFIDGDTLIIKAQVQVIRERADRPFRCLDCQYRRELVRVYLTNVEQICRRFVEERRSKLGKLIEDKARWSSFCAFWMGIDQTVKRRMSREKTDAILRIIVKHFFIEKEVTSTLVMDSLYSGLKALEGQTKSKIGRGQLLDAEELPVPIICIERDVFVLVDDVLLLLERAAVEPLPPKDDKGPQNRMKDGCAGEEFNKDSIERDERRLTELGRRTIEIFVLAHVFSKIEVAYQEAVSLKRQEELIREEAAWLAETEHKAKRGTADKDKKSKKKQAKQKRNNRKGKDKGRDEKPSAALQDKLQQERPADERKDFTIEKAEPELGKHDIPEDVSDVSDSVECQPSILQPDSEDRDPSPVNWDTDTSEAQPSTEACSSGVSGLSAVQNGMRERNSPSVVDDSSSTCSTDSVPSMKTSGPYKGNSLPNQKNQKSPRRGTNQGGRSTSDATGWANEVRCQLSEAMSDLEEPNDASGSYKVESESEAVVIKELEQHVMKKLEEVDSLQREKIIKDQADTEKPKKEKMTEAPSSPSSTRKTLPSAVRIVSESKSVATDPVLVRKPSSDSFQPTERPALMTSSAANIKAALSSDTHKAAAPKPSDKPLVQQVPVTSRPLSAPITPGPRPTAPIVSMVQTAQLLPRSVSAAGRLGPDTSSTTHSYVPQSYRNAIMGPPATQPHSSSSFGNPLHLYSQTSNLISPPILLPTSSERVELNMVKPGLPFGRVNHEVLQNGPQWTEPSQRDNSSRSMHYDPSSLHDGTHNNLDFYQPVHSRSQDRFPSELPASTSGRQSHGAALADDFPHLDIINDLLLDDEQGIVRAAVRASASFQGFSNEPRPHHLNRQFSFPGEIGMSNNDMSPSTSSGRFERTRSYLDDGFQQHGYGSLQGHFDFESLRQAQAAAAAAAAHPIPYVNGQQIDGLIANHRHWQISGSEMPPQSHLGTRNMDGDGIGGGYPYHHNIPDYSNPASSSSLGGGYGVLPPSNGH